MRFEKLGEWRLKWWMATPFLGLRRSLQFRQESLMQTGFGVADNLVRENKRMLTDTTDGKNSLGNIERKQPILDCV